MLIFCLSNKNVISCFLLEPFLGAVPSNFQKRWLFDAWLSAITGFSVRFYLRICTGFFPAASWSIVTHLPLSSKTHLPDCSFNFNAVWDTAQLQGLAVYCLLLKIYSLEKRYVNEVLIVSSQTELMLYANSGNPYIISWDGFADFCKIRPYSGI